MAPVDYAYTTEQVHADSTPQGTTVAPEEDNEWDIYDSQYIAFDVQLECRSIHSTETAAKKHCLSLDGCNAMRWLPRERADANACFGIINDIENPRFDSSLSTNSLWNTGVFTGGQGCIPYTVEQC